MNKIKYFIEGLIIGLGKIIPGVSGSLFAMIFGVYEKIIETISKPKTIKENGYIIIPLFLGIVFAIIFGSNFIKILFVEHYIESMSLFIGLMSYGVFPTYKNVVSLKPTKKQIIISLLIVSFVILPFLCNFKTSEIVVSNGFYEFMSLTLCGILDAISTIIPGISGTAILMLIGYYEKIITALSMISELSSFFQGFKILIPFFLGFGLSLIYMAKLISYLFKKHPNLMHTSILFFAVTSEIILLYNLLKRMTFNEVIPAVIIFLIGFLISYAVETKLGG